MNQLRAALRAAEVHLKLQVVNPLAYLGAIIFPVAVTAIGLIVLSPGGYTGRIAYAALGGGLVGLYGTAYTDAGFSINSERWTGTLEQLMGSPTPLSVIVIGKVAASMLYGLAAILVSVGLAFVAFHRVLPLTDAVPFAVSFLLTIVAFFAVCMAMAPVFPMARWAFTIVNGLELTVYLLCGFMFPTGQLPGWVQAISSILPPTWTIRALYAATGQPVGRDYARWWLIASVLIVIYLAISIVSFRIVEVRTRMSGQLALA
ncbi:MAG: ABC transporter permease [Candidatus Dormibacteraeota bacterium]|nr:ABC transporter permease [Candidatus Dormibacteraeota bacterium]